MQDVAARGLDWLSSMTSSRRRRRRYLLDVPDKINTYWSPTPSLVGVSNQTDRAVAAVAEAVPVQHMGWTVTAAEIL